MVIVCYNLNVYGFSMFLMIFNGEFYIYICIFHCFKKFIQLLLIDYHLTFSFKKVFFINILFN